MKYRSEFWMCVVIFVVSINGIFCLFFGQEILGMISMALVSILACCLLLWSVTNVFGGRRKK